MELAMWVVVVGLVFVVIVQAIVISGMRSQITKIAAMSGEASKKATRAEGVASVAMQTVRPMDTRMDRVEDLVRKNFVGIQPVMAGDVSELEEDISLLERRGWVKSSRDGEVMMVRRMIGSDGEWHDQWHAWPDEGGGWMVRGASGGTPLNVDRAADILLYVEKYDG